MKHFKKTDGTIFAFPSDGSQDYLITEDMTELTAQELDDAMNPDPSLEDCQDTHRDVLRLACATAITTMFQSSALGPEHSYDCRVEDQANLRGDYIGSTIDTLNRPVSAHDGVEFTDKSHTTEQLGKVSLSMGAHIRTQKDKLKGLIAAVNAVTASADPAADLAAVLAITWSA